MTDSTNGNVLGFSFASGVLTRLSGSPYPAGNQPSAIVVDPNYPYAYVANALDGNGERLFDGSSGALTSIGTYDCGHSAGGHRALIRGPATLSSPSTSSAGVSTVSDFELSTTDGTLVNAQHSPLYSNALPTAVAAVPHTAAAQTE